MRRGIIITGVSGAGKTTIAQALADRDPSFRQITAVTTRAPRPDDPPEVFEYLDDSQFDALEAGNALLIRAEYRDRRYGITHAHLRALEERGQVPLLLVTPRSLFDFVEQSRSRTPAEVPFLTVFIDAPDPVLDERLGDRADGERRIEILRQREEDRRYRGSCRYVLEDLDLDRGLEQLLGWWQVS
jgi:guanylate kinase